MDLRELVESDSWKRVCAFVCAMGEILIIPAGKNSKSWACDLICSFIDALDKFWARSGHRRNEATVLPGFMGWGCILPWCFLLFTASARKHLGSVPLVVLSSVALACLPNSFLTPNHSLSSSNRRGKGEEFSLFCSSSRMKIRDLQSIKKY